VENTIEGATADVAGLHRKILLSPPDVGEREKQALVAAFDSGWIAPAGPSLSAFETEMSRFLDAESCVALSSGSAALELGLLVTGVEPGDEVVVPTSTFAATAFAVKHVGAIPVFCDVDPDTWCLDLGLFENFLADRAAIGSLPAAVMPVDLYGQMPDYELLERICERFGVRIVEDAAESLGSSQGQRMAGTFGDVGVLSFNGNKIITTSGGGMLIGSIEVVQRARHLSTQARMGSLHYEHEEVGFNYRMSNLLAALGAAQLEGLPPKIRRRQQIRDTYESSLPEMTWQGSTAHDVPNSWLSVGLFNDGRVPSEVCASLALDHIEARPFWKPMHLQPVFAGAQCVGGSVAEDLFKRGIALPSGSSLSEVDQERVLCSLRATETVRSLM